MKKIFLILLCFMFTFASFSCKENKSYLLTEDNFFLVMTNMQYYPGQYLNSVIEYDCFTYTLKDVDGNDYICGVRKCSSGFGCTCGKDTIIGFLLNYDGELPEPKNQSEDTVEKTWIHIKGKIDSVEKKTITANSYFPNGEINPNNTEKIVFLEMNVESYSMIENYKDLKYYVTK